MAKLGDSLINMGILQPKELEIALEIQKRTSGLLGEILVDLGFISEENLAMMLSKDAGVVLDGNLSDFELNEEAVALVPKDLALKYDLVPLSLDNNTLKIAMADPYNIVAIDEVKKVSGMQIQAVMAFKDAIQSAIAACYIQSGNDLEQAIQEADSGIAGVELEAQSGPIVRIVNIIIHAAIKERATDIHIEPEKHIIIVRFRIDGMMRLAFTIPHTLLSPIVSRIKIMANLDISESRLPQDGKIPFSYGSRSVDLRLSTFPTNNGENLVIRILDRMNLIGDITHLGFTSHNTQRLKQLTDEPYGIILVTGPTGSGKTTTLYASLLSMDYFEKNIMTVEDPIEYTLPFVRQSQINPKAGYTFASGTRTILRQDPDVVLIGEMRDPESVEIAIQCALTGHLVFSTLHTNDSAGAFPRLIEMGAEPFLLVSSVLGVLAQRLVRQVCDRCAAPYTPTDPERRIINEHFPEASYEKLRTGAGCDYCNNTGYRGRTAVTEVMIIDENVANAITKKPEARHIRDAAIKSGMVSLRKDAMDKALMGITTLREVFRVTAR